MATTSPDNIRTPDSGDSYALVQDMGILADTVQNALIKRANAYVGTVSQRTAFTSQAPTGTIWSDTDGERLVWKKGATEWEPLSPKTPKILSGSTQLEGGANVTRSKEITFPPGFFTSPPLVVVSAVVSNPDFTRASVNFITITGATIYVRRNDSGVQPVHWIAVQMED